MEIHLSNTMPRYGVRGLLSWLLFVVLGSSQAACGDGNQSPFAKVDSLPTTKVMTTRSSEEYIVDYYFRDPDQDRLSFGAFIDDATVATAVLKDLDDSLRLAIEGIAVGEAVVTLTATDPYGGEAEISGQVVVAEPELFWRDDFDFSTDEWAFSGTYSYDRRPGSLAGISGDVGAWRIDSDYAVDWMVSMSVAAEFGSNNQTVGSWVYVEDSASNPAKRWLWTTVGHATQYQYIKDAVTPSNWQVVWCCGYTWGAGGMSDAVSIAGEFTEVHWGVRTGKMTVYIGETLLWSEDAIEGEWPPIHVRTSLFSYSGGGEAYQWVYFDWAELWGVDAYVEVGDVTGDWQLEHGLASFAASDGQTELESDRDFGTLRDALTQDAKGGMQ